MKVALVYDRVNKWGGAERVLLALNKIFPNADLYTSVYDSKKTPWARVFRIKTSFLQNFPKAKSFHELYATLMPVAFESFDFSDYDLVISVTSESAKGIITKPQTLHICYMLTPTRYLWSGFETYFKNPIFKFLSTPFVYYLRKWDIIASDRPDKFISISKEVAARIKKFYKKDSVVIYPPLMLSDIKPQEIEEKDYFLIVSRLVPYKKIDIAMKAFNQLKLPLIIIGSGWEETKLKQMAKSNIKFLKNLSDEALYGYYKHCKALIFPGFEDFGLSMVEAQYFGKPVIALGKGGALEIVRQGKTGEFFDGPNTESLIKVLEKFDDTLYNEKLCRENALRFSSQRFKKEILKFIEKN